MKYATFLVPYTLKHVKTRYYYEIKQNETKQALYS